MEQANDFVEESKSLHDLLHGRSDPDYSKVTQFKAWTINDVLRHLHFWNWMAELQLSDEARLVAELKNVAASGMRAAEQGFASGLEGGPLLEAWWRQAQATATQFASADPKARLKWAGPDMSARSSITARLMETWAHGQEVFDSLGASRSDADRIRNIAVLGVNTFGWTYHVRGEKPPAVVPYVRLKAPSGAVWEFGEPSESERIEGAATEFCQVVTQTRNVQDTNLAVTGSIATDWMSKAQCFAGAPADPPSPGSRYRDAVQA